MEVQPEVVALACDDVRNVRQDLGVLPIFLGVGDRQDARIDCLVEALVGGYGLVEILDHVLELVLYLGFFSVVSPTTLFFFRLDFGYLQAQLDPTSEIYKRPEWGSRGRTGAHLSR